MVFIVKRKHFFDQKYLFWSKNSSFEILFSIFKSNLNLQFDIEGPKFEFVYKIRIYRSNSTSNSRFVVEFRIFLCRVRNSSELSYNTMKSIIWSLVIRYNHEGLFRSCDFVLCIILLPFSIHL